VKIGIIGCVINPGSRSELRDIKGKVCGEAIIAIEGEGGTVTAVNTERAIIIDPTTSTKTVFTRLITIRLGGICFIKGH
jgi:hypothetical protein